MQDCQTFARLSNEKNPNRLLVPEFPHVYCGKLLEQFKAKKYYSSNRSAVDGGGGGSGSGGRGGDSN